MNKETAKQLAALGERIDRIEAELMRFIPIQPPPIEIDDSEVFDIGAICDKIREEDEVKALEE